MAEINVKRKKNNSWRIGLLTIIAFFLLWWFFMRKDRQMVTRLSPITDSIKGEEISTLHNDTLTPLRDTVVRGEDVR